MSIDCYPALDAEKELKHNNEEIGAASLFYHNDGTLFPEFNGHDLQSQFPGIAFKMLCFDGATTEDLLSKDRNNEITSRNPERTIVTLSLGGNDLLNSLYRNRGKSKEVLANEIRHIQERYTQVLTLIQKRLPGCTLIVTTVYDPTDDTGIMPAHLEHYKDEFPTEFLHRFNDFLRALARDRSLHLADAHKHFSGHGALCGDASRFWFWKTSPIEPGYRGASEIRRLWWEALTTHKD